MNYTIQYNTILNSIKRREKIFHEIKTNPKYKELLDILNSNSSLNKEYVLLFRYYMLKYLPKTKKKKKLLDKTFLDSNNSTLFKFLDKGEGTDFRPSGLIQICISLDLSYEESFDLFMACGRNLTSDSPITTICDKILKNFCKKSSDLDCLSRLIEINDYCEKNDFKNFIAKKSK